MTGEDRDAITTAAGTVFYRRRGPAAPAAMEAGVVRRVLERLAEALDAVLAGGPDQRIDLSQLDMAAHAALADRLGQGEVRVTVRSPVAAAIDEARLAGVWRVHRSADAGDATSESLEVGAAPATLSRALADIADAPLCVAGGPADAMRARSLLTEIDHRASRHRLDGVPRVIDLTTLPLGPADRLLLDRVLGSGPVEAVASCFGRCHARATPRRHVWRVSYVNADDRLLLETVEICAIPSGIIAQREDMTDGRARLATLIAACR